jgi:hypothetical protein
MPTDQHAATGTCELGERDIRTLAPDHKCFVHPEPHFFASPIRMPSGAGSSRTMICRLQLDDDRDGIGKHCHIFISRQRRMP